MKVINLFAGPGTGKSTLAMELMVAMKKAGLRVEHVRDIPREDVYWKSWRRLDDHLLQLAQIQSAMNMAREDNDYLVVESPILMRLAYLPKEARDLSKTIASLHGQEDSVNIFLERNPDFAYDQAGRDQDFETAVARGESTRKILEDHSPDYFRVMAGDGALEQALRAAGLERAIPGRKGPETQSEGAAESFLRSDSAPDADALSTRFISLYPYVGCTLDETIRFGKSDAQDWEERHGRGSGHEGRLFLGCFRKMILNACRMEGWSLSDHGGTADQPKILLTAPGDSDSFPHDDSPSGRSAFGDVVFGALSRMGALGIAKSSMDLSPPAPMEPQEPKAPDAGPRQPKAVF